jgi:uncharacterized protein YegP (UPF0339 family)
MAAKFDLKRGGNEQYMFNLKAANGEVILTSQLYNEKTSAVHGIESVKVNSVEDGHFERKRARTGEPFFVLKAANGEIIGKSETYSSSWAMERGIRSVKRNAPTARVDDKSAENESRHYTGVGVADPGMSDAR